jgi:uncharacterized protein (DUF433 family)
LSPKGASFTITATGARWLLIGHSVRAAQSVLGKLNGTWVFPGTRIPPAAVFGNLEDGLAIDDIVQMFDGLTREPVRAVLDFAAHSLDAPAPTH